MEGIKSGTYATLTPDAVISSVKTELGIEASNQHIWFRKLINESVRHIDALSIFVKRQCILPVDCGVAILPDGFFRMLAITIGDGCGTCTNAIYVDLPFLRQCGCNMNENGQSQLGSTFEIQDNKIIFHSPFFNPDNNDSCTTDDDADSDDDQNNGQPIRECRIAFMGLNVDDKGLMKIYTDMERGITAYVCWKYTRQNFKEYPQYIQEGFKQEWISQKKWLKGLAYQENAREEAQQILEVVNAILVDKAFIL